MSTTYISHVDLSNEIWRCATCGCTAKENRQHYRYGERKPSEMGGKGDTAWCSISSAEMVPCGPMVKGRWVPDE